MTGIDKVFDYAVPPAVRGVQVGDRVRVDLNGRRVGGWVVALSPAPSGGLEYADLRPIVSRSGRGVDPDVVDLCRWVADRWCGPLRAVLASASSPKIRAGVAHPRHGTKPAEPTDPIGAAVREVRDRGGGLVRIPPAASALTAVFAAATSGPVLVVCPTQRMARLGAAALRRRGLGVACLPDDWETAAVGADVVIGARTTVFAPCPGVSTIVVIDEHDETLKEERSPSWDATSVAVERARRMSIPVVCTSPVPSADSLVRWPGSHGVATTSNGWPRVEIEDLSRLDVSGTLLGRALLAAARDVSSVTLALLNTKGRARLLACSTCAALQKCSECRALLAETHDGLTCERCASTRPAMCGECGRTSLRTLKAGTTGLCSQIERSTGRRPIEVTAESPLDGLTGGLFVGTEAVLRRIDTADTVIFCDVDRDLGAPRLTAPREVAADLARAARVVGARGRLVIQTRDPGHPLLVAAAAADPDAALAEFLDRDVAIRKSLELPPFSTLVTLSAERDLSVGDAPTIRGVDWSSDRGTLIARIAADVDLGTTVAAVSARTGLKLRVHVAPSRH